jgi:hypothetical protein
MRPGSLIPPCADADMMGDGVYLRGVWLEVICMCS